MRAYLSQYPDGRFAALGRISERRLCKVAPEVVVSTDSESEQESFARIVHKLEELSYLSPREPG